MSAKNDYKGGELPVRVELPLTSVSVATDFSVDGILFESRRYVLLRGNQ